MARPTLHMWSMKSLWECKRHDRQALGHCLVRACPGCDDGSWAEASGGNRGVSFAPFQWEVIPAGSHREREQDAVWLEVGGRMKNIPDLVVEVALGENNCGHRRRCGKSSCLCLGQPRRHGNGACCSNRNSR